MDYEKKYKEALDRAKSMYESSDEAELAAYIFPELRESEDERIRKWILEYLYDGLRKSDEQFKEQFKTAIAWLEKQKECCLAIPSGDTAPAENDTISKNEQEFLENEIKAFLCNYDKEFDDDAPTYDIAEHFYRLGKKAQEKQKEPKDFPITDEKVKELLDNTPPTEVPEKYKTPDWLFEKQKEQKVDIDKLRKDIYQSGYNDGYQHGKEDAEEAYNKSVAYHYPTMPQRPLCWEPGGTCTNPQMDCINCPKKTTGGMFTTPNTASGTSTLKAEG